MNIPKEKINSILRIFFGIVFSILLILFWLMMKSGEQYSKDILRNYLPAIVLEYLSGIFSTIILILMLIFIVLVTIKLIIMIIEFVLVIAGRRKRRAGPGARGKL